jgi:hypothetical protein
MEEVEHKISVLEGTKQALLEKNASWLRELSNQTIHCASVHQDSGSIVTAVLVYSLSKLVERKDFAKIKGWDKMVHDLSELFTLAIKAAMENEEEEYNKNMGRAREVLDSFGSIKKYVDDVMRKAAVNKAAKVYEHGISLGQAASLLGLTNWELAEYTGQGKTAENKYNETISEKERAKTALDFFEVKE